MGDILLDARALPVLAVALAATAALAGAFFIGLLARPVWTVAILPALWVAGAVALGLASGRLGSPRDLVAVAGGVLVLLAFWALGRRRRG